MLAGVGGQHRPGEAVSHQDEPRDSQLRHQPIEVVRQRVDAVDLCPVRFPMPPRIECHRPARRAKMIELRLPAGPFRSEPVVEDHGKSAAAAVRDPEPACASVDEHLLLPVPRWRGAGASAKDDQGGNGALHHSRSPDEDIRRAFHHAAWGLATAAGCGMPRPPPPAGGEQSLTEDHHAEVHRLPRQAAVVAPQRAG